MAPAAPGRQALARIHRGRHPSNSLKIENDTGAVGIGVQVSAVFDADTMTWRSDPRVRHAELAKEGDNSREDEPCTAVDGVEVRRPENEWEGGPASQGQADPDVRPGGGETADWEEEDPFGHGGSLAQQDGGTLESGGGAQHSGMKSVIK